MQYDMRVTYNNDIYYDFLIPLFLKKWMQWLKMNNGCITASWDGTYCDKSMHCYWVCEPIMKKILKLNTIKCKWITLKDLGISSTVSQ